MTNHQLKIWPEFYQAIVEGAKTYEVREGTDRLYQAGDTVTFKEFDVNTDDGFTGRECEARITYVTPPGTFGLPPNVTVFGIKVIPEIPMLYYAPMPGKYSVEVNGQRKEVIVEDPNVPIDLEKLFNLPVRRRMHANYIITTKPIREESPNEKAAE